MLVSSSLVRRGVGTLTRLGNLSPGLELRSLMPSGLLTRPLGHVYNPSSSVAVLGWSKEFYSWVRAVWAPDKVLPQSFLVRWEVGRAVFPAWS